MVSATTKRWLEVYAAIDELEWFVRRRPNLSEPVEPSEPDLVWADTLNEDIEELRRALRSVAPTTSA